MASELISKHFCYIVSIISMIALSTVEHTRTRSSIFSTLVNQTIQLSKSVYFVLIEAGSLFLDELIATFGLKNLDAKLKFALNGTESEVID